MRINCPACGEKVTVDIAPEIKRSVSGPAERWYPGEPAELVEVNGCDCFEMLCNREEERVFIMTGGRWTEDSYEEEVFDTLCQEW